MSELALTIVEPKNGAGSVVEAAEPLLQAELTGDATGLFFRWFSSLNGKATEDNPELNPEEYGPAALSWSAALPEFGTHVITLAATDQKGIDQSSLKAVTRAAMAGGAPPAESPCVIHRLVAKFLTPAVDGLSLSKGNATIEVLAPAPWAKEEPADEGSWIVDRDYQKLNGVGLSLRLAPDGELDPAHSADIILDLTSAEPTPFFRAKDPTDPEPEPKDQTWFCLTGPLPSNLETGNYVLTLTVTGGGASTSTTRRVVLTE